MKVFLFLMFSSVSLVSISQIPRSGSYIYRYCDMEYNKCLGTCKIVIKKDHVTVYATKELAGDNIGFKESDVIAKGIIAKGQSGKWVIVKNKQQATQKNHFEEPLPTLDFKNKQYWQL